MANPTTTTVEISCDRYGVCCARPVSSRKAVRGEVCGMDYKFPWDDFGVTRRQRKEIDSGWSVRKRVGYWSWQDMVSAWGEGGALFGRAPKKNRARWRKMFRQLAKHGTDCVGLYKACKPKLGWECDAIQDACFTAGARRGVVPRARRR